jgi:hypothetical protein
MARCRVSFTDSEKLEHSAEVEAESLYEAVALAVADFRDDPLLRDHPGDQTEFTVVVLRNPTQHKLRLSQVAKWGYAMSRADLVIIPAQGSHLDATEAVKAIKLVKGQEKAFQRKIPFAILFTRTSAAIRPRFQNRTEDPF